MASTSERLQALLTKDGGEGLPKKGQLPADVFAEVLGDIRKERTDQAKVQAKELIIKALTLKEQGDKLDADYEKTKKARDKELGKAINQIENMLAGRPLNEGENNKEEDKPSDG